MINTNAKVEGDKSKRQIAQEEKVRFWQGHIRGWRESGISQVGYCREHGLKETAFTYWKGKLTQDRSGTTNCLLWSQILYFCTFRHSRERGNPEVLILLDSRVRGNDG
jgi:hypothetical protein